MKDTLPLWYERNPGSGIVTLSMLNLDDAEPAANEAPFFNRLWYRVTHLVEERTAALIGFFNVLFYLLLIPVIGAQATPALALGMALIPLAWATVFAVAWHKVESGAMSTWANSLIASLARLGNAIVIAVIIVTIIFLLLLIGSVLNAARLQTRR